MAEELPRSECRYCEACGDCYVCTPEGCGACCACSDIDDEDCVIHDH